MTWLDSAVVNILKKNENGEIELDFEKLKNILRNPDFENHHVALLSILGPYRSGKSFLLSLLKHFHHNRQQQVSSLLY